MNSYPPDVARALRAAELEARRWDTRPLDREHREKTHALTRSGSSVQEIAAQLGITQRHVQRIRLMPATPRPTLLDTSNVSDQRETELEQLVDLALELACRLREENPTVVWGTLTRLSRTRLQELTTVLASMVPVDLPVSRLLGWVTSLPAARYEEIA